KRLSSRARLAMPDARSPIRSTSSTNFCGIVMKRRSEATGCGVARIWIAGRSVSFSSAWMVASARIAGCAGASYWSLSAVTARGIGDPDFAKVRDALGVASYVEQLHLSEQQWLMNRLAWLFTSQSFCILAYVTLITKAPGAGDDTRVAFLKVGLPVFGVVC